MDTKQGTWVWAALEVMNDFRRLGDKLDRRRDAHRNALQVVRWQAKRIRHLERELRAARRKADAAVQSLNGAPFKDYGNGPYE